MSLFSTPKSPENLLLQRSKLYGEVSKLYEKIAQIDKELKQMKESGAEFTMPKTIKIKATGDDKSTLEIRELGSVKIEKPSSAGIASATKKAWTIPKMKEFCALKKIECPKNGKRDEYVELIRNSNKVREMDRFMLTAE